MKEYKGQEEQIVVTESDQIISKEMSEDILMETSTQIGDQNKRKEVKFAAQDTAELDVKNKGPHEIIQNLGQNLLSGKDYQTGEALAFPDLAAILEELHNSKWIHDP